MKEIVFVDAQSVLTILTLGMVKKELHDRVGPGPHSAYLGHPPTLLTFAGEAAAELAELHAEAAATSGPIGFVEASQRVYVSASGSRLSFRVER